MRLVQPSFREVPSREREAHGLCHQYQGRGHGFHRCNELGDDDQFLARLGTVLGKKHEPEATAPQVLYFAQSRNKNVRHLARLDQPQRRLFLGKPMPDLMVPGESGPRPTDFRESMS